MNLILGFMKETGFRGYIKRLGEECKRENKVCTVGGTTKNLYTSVRVGYRKRKG